MTCLLVRCSNSVMPTVMKLTTIVISTALCLTPLIELYSFVFPNRGGCSACLKRGVSNRWNGIWNGTVEWKMEWNGECM